MGITVLSLFDGISCGMVALERAGIEVDKYIAYRAGSMGDRGRHNNSGYYRTAGACVSFQ